MIIKAWDFWKIWENYRKYQIPYSCCLSIYLIRQHLVSPCPHKTN